MKIPPSLVITPLYGFYNVLCSTLTYREVGRERIEAVLAESSCVLALWHDELFPLMQIRRHLRMMAVVSQSSDGEILAGVLERLGVACVRGSSSRGGVKALLAAARMLGEAHQGACVTVDGPRGPRHKAKEGAVFLASKAGVPLVPVRLFMDRAYAFGSWDRFQLPLPFSHVTAVFGEPKHVHVDIRDAEGLERERQLLETRLENLAP